MRADRLIALLLLLQTRPKLTAAEVATELEVSERTARRDLEALAMSGVPIYSTPGRGGGWQLIGDARTDLTGLSADEARAVFLATGSSIDRSPALRSAMRKLTGALPETFRAEAEAASTAIKVDPDGWGQLGRGSAPTHLDTLTNAVTSRRRVSLEYESPTSGWSTREVSPLGLVTKRNTWYLVAKTEKGMRTFRLSRVRSVEVLETLVERPPDFDLETEWDRIIGEIETLRTGIEVRVFAQPEIVPVLRYQFAGRITVGPTTDNGRVHVTVTDNGARPMAAQLACHGANIEVIDPPPELRAEFERISAELAAMWL